MVGIRVARQLALRVDQAFTVRHDDRERTLRVAGLVSTGGDEEEQIFVPLPVAQELLGLRKGADKVLVSALVEPEENLRKDLRGVDPSKMTPEQYETWYCSPIMGAVTKQIEEALPGTKARPIRRIAEAEGAFLGKVGLLMTLLTLTALAAAGLAVMTSMTATVQERRAEIGLMKAIGAGDAQVAFIFLSQAGLIGLAGGLLGYVAGLGLAIFIGQQVFDAAIALPPLLLPVVLVLAQGVALAGSALPVRRAMHFDPASLLGAAK
jgi:putative ABC transport system permease protein